MTAFNIEAVRKVTGLSLRQIRYCEQKGLVRPSVRAASGRGSRRLYSFEDLIELRVIAKLRDAGLSLQKVRKVADHLHRHHRELQRPLANVRLVVDGERVLISSDAGKVEDALRSGQTLLVVPLDAVWNATQASLVMIADKRADELTVHGQRYAVTFEPDLEDGGWIAECPALPGCLSQGDTLAEARRMIREAIVGWLSAQPGVERAGKRSWGR